MDFAFRWCFTAMSIKITLVKFWPRVVEINSYDGDNYATIMLVVPIFNNGDQEYAYIQWGSLKDSINVLYKYDIRVKKPLINNW